MISKTSIIIFSLCLVISLSQICLNPQKLFYLSYDAIGNREYLSNLFENISQSLPKYDITYNDKNGSIYQISNFHPHYYYNSHLQIQQYNTQYSVNVTLGQLYIAYRFDFSIKHENKNSSGWARGKTLVDHYVFSKKVKLDSGAIHWQPDHVPPIQINDQLYVQYSNPTFTAEQLAIINQLLQGHLGDNKMKQSIINKTNQLFPAFLKDHLNHQQLLKSGQIIYKYNNITLNFTHVVKEFKMSNLKTKGLEVFMLFGLDTPSPFCNELPTQFDQDSYGGVQQMISMGSIKQALIQAINHGLFDMELDKKAESPYFQFYMGDLGNFVPYANQLPSIDTFTVKCNFARQRSSDFKVKGFTDHEIYVAAPVDCQLVYQNATILKAMMDLTLIVKIVSEENYLLTEFSKIGIFTFNYESVNPKFVISDEIKAKYAVQAILNKFIGQRTFGTNWPLFYRKYPANRVLDDYVIFFDPAQK